MKLYREQYQEQWALDRELARKQLERMRQQEGRRYKGPIIPLAPILTIAAIILVPIIPFFVL